ncbi:hypothetical protein KP509_13G051000 [Ceratopteris richardii]|uniref:Iron transporter n=1 Tax=Ceratopteris richardii TaxID=49495 RepID=A0A8T2TIR7_CERRI|nr:hypothetical protein KP509_13G051000 [Ceratopteris richardii]
MERSSHRAEGETSGRHEERHVRSGEVMRDVVMGLTDGLTVPFALAAGLSSTSPSLVVTAGLAEIAAGAIAMGLGGYLAAKSDSDHYDREKKREEFEVKTLPEDEADEVMQILGSFGLQELESRALVNALRKRPNDWVDFMMRFELGLEKPDPGRAMRSGLTIATSYTIGGLVPLLPYMLVKDMHTALMVSMVVTLFALLLFGYIKGVINGTRAILSAFHTTTIGALASGAAFAIAKYIQGN